MTAVAATPRATLGVMDIPAVGAIVHDEQGRLLVVRRGRAPGLGKWSIPGGRVEAGEALADAARREVREETGLRVDVQGVVGTIELPGASAGDSYQVTDFVATVVAGSSGEPVAADDATDARWVTQDELIALDTTAGLTDALRAWGVWI